jgi:peptidyl-prolyl cis-trans isomerase B (cyclophilin B)
MIRSILIFFLIVTTGSAFGQKHDELVKINTRFGEMIVVLYDETPKHKSNFIKLAKERFFDSLLFHRVMKEFMIQGGDPESKKSPKGAQLGSGGPGYTIDAEINPKFYHHKGALAAARMPDQANPKRASSGSQFYIVQGKKMTEAQLNNDQKFNNDLRQFLAKPENGKYVDSVNIYRRKNDQAGFAEFLKRMRPVVEQSLGMKVDKELAAEIKRVYSTEGGAPHLDGQYTVFGKVIKGIEVVDSIAAQQTDRADRPVEDIRMTMHVIKMKRKKISKLYGYKYPG